MDADGGNQEQWAQTAMFTASEVEAQTGVPAATLRQWERRYGFPLPARSDSGYRLYSPQDIRAIGVMQGHQQRGVSARLAAEMTLRGVSAGVASAGVARSGSNGVAGSGATVPAPGGPAPGGPAPVNPAPGRSAAELAEALAEALIAADYARSTDLLAEAHARLNVEDVMTAVMSPALVEIGQRWAQGQITIAHERGASHFLRSRLSALMDIAGVEETGGNAGLGPLVVAACAPGEQHELGLMMLTLALRRRGVRVAYLGANVPLGDLTTFAHQHGAQALLLAVNGDWALQGWVPGEWKAGRWLPDAQSGSERVFNGVESTPVPPPLKRLGLPVFLGGALLNAQPELATQLGGVYAGPDAPSAAAIISGALGHSLYSNQLGEHS